MITCALTGYLADWELLGGWPLTFYASGATGVVAFLLIQWLVSSDPETHRYVSSEELEYIRGKNFDVEPCSDDEASDKQCHASTKALPVPWRAMLTNKPFVGQLVSSLIGSFSYSLLSSKLPDYMHK